MNINKYFNIFRTGYCIVDAVRQLFFKLFPFLLGVVHCEDMGVAHMHLHAFERISLSDQHQRHRKTVIVFNTHKDSLTIIDIDKLEGVGRGFSNTQTAIIHILY